MKATIDDKSFIELFEEIGPRPLARRIGVGFRKVLERRVRLENKYRRQITAPDGSLRSTRRNIEHEHRLRLSVDNGVVLIGSDSHYIPGHITTAHRAFVKFARELKPKIIIKNGDELDFPKASRHIPIGWEKRPDLIDEIEWAQERLQEIEDAAPKAIRTWPLGNHDSRWETRLATLVPEYARTFGFKLKDHFKSWTPCWATWINDDVVVKHRWKGGDNAPYNNTIKSGKTIFTGHLHSLQVRPYSDYNGTRFGVDCGTMADPYGDAFYNYTEDNSVDWRSGFIVATFHKGRLLWPEVVHVVNKNEVDFRGKIYKI